MTKPNFNIEEAVNEPIKDYISGSDEKISLKSKLEELKSQTFDIPIMRIVCQNTKQNLKIKPF